MNRELAKSVAAAIVVISATSTQAVFGYADLGGRLGVERHVAIKLAAVLVVIVIAWWATVVDLTLTHRWRVGVGVSVTLAAVAFAVVLLWLTYTRHCILMVQSRQGHVTVTTFRGALTKTEARVSFHAGTASPVTLLAIDTHDRVGVNAVHVEHTSDTDFKFHSFQFEQRVTLVHASDAPLKTIVDTVNAVTFMTPAGARERLRRDIVLGGAVWLAVSSAIYVASLLSRRRSKRPHPIGFRTPV